MNILVVNGKAKIGDFGLAKHIAVAPRGHAGTTMYMSPETLKGETPNTPADIYSLGLVLIELIWPMKAEDIWVSIKSIEVKKCLF